MSIVMSQAMGESNPGMVSTNPRFYRFTFFTCTQALVLWVAVLWMAVSNNAVAAPLNCPVENRISVDFENGAGWDMCWESRLRENIVLSDIYYRNVESNELKIISSLRLAQLHVTYDDDEVTFNDVTQFGLGGGHVSVLIDTDCPDGELVDINGRAGMCKRLSIGDSAFHTSGEARLKEVLTLFSISQVGAYAYLVTWKFYDDGSVAPSVGAAGALQRSSDDEHTLFGRQLGGVPEKSWLSHTHNYYWRIDFDLGDDATDDVVNEVSYTTDEKGRRSRSVERLVSESAREIDPDNLLAWHISSGAEDFTRAPGYVIEPLSYGHKLVHKETEPFTEFDFFVTRQDDCERFITENAKFHPECGEDILEFVNDESLIDEDIVVWHRISFHHVPRNEDRHRMHSHWDGFLMRASNMSSLTPGHSGQIGNSPPELVLPTDLRHSTSEEIEVKIVASDPDGDELLYQARGLPDGISINASGVITGVAEKSGIYDVTVVVSDSVNTLTGSFKWQIEGVQSGSLDPIIWMALALLAVVRRRYQ